MSSTVLVTGGTGGLGTAVTARFLAAGWRVVVPRRPEGKSDGPRRPEGESDGPRWPEGEFDGPRPEGESDGPRRPEGKSDGPREETRLELVSADLFDPASTAACVELAAAVETAPLTAVVNLVGGFAMTGRVHETPVEDFEDQLRLNLRPTYLVCHYAIPRLLDVSGSIVCVSSRAAVRPFAGAAGYISAKAAVLAFVDALHAEYVGQGLRVNAVLPSVIDTPGNRRSQPDADASRWVPPQQIADVIHFLCDPASAAVGGAHVPVYGRA